MQRDTGIYKEAVAFLLIVLTLANLEMAWSTAFGPGFRMHARARASGSILASDILLKPPQTKFHSNKPPGKSAKKSPGPQAPAARDMRRDLAAFFNMRGSAYPPERVVFIAVKDEKRLEVWARDPDGTYRYIMEYPICAVSGMYGPKLRRGDKQVPEGVYSIVGLNPYSKYHLSMRLDYPNEFDRKMAAADGRTDLGGDIFIHGDCRSIGCIAMGDPVIEELYALIRDTGAGKARVIIAPWDLRKKRGRFVLAPGMPQWTPALYDDIASAMAPYTEKAGYGAEFAMAAGVSRSY